MIKRMEKLIHNRILSLNYKGSHTLAGLLHRWLEVYTC
ncbi:unnamed protein product [Brassica oleracea]